MQATATKVGGAGAAERFQRLKADIHKEVVERLDISKLGRLPKDHLRREVRGVAAKIIQTRRESVPDLDQERMVGEIMNEAFGLGPLEALMNDPTISDILVNGAGKVYVERRGRLEPTGILFADNHHLIQIIQRLTGRVGRRVDEMSPLVDARLEDGSRLNAIIPPLALDGPVLSIRRFGMRLQSEDLLANLTLTPEMLKLLQACIEARLNMVIAGGAGAGKTTMLNVLSRFIPADERLVTIEDSAELQLQQPHTVRLETRLANVEGEGAYTQRDLVRNSLRMRPDRIIIGECRGPEALDMLQAMNTGHDGSLTTVHANDIRDTLARLEMMVTMAGFEMPLSVIRNYIGSALRVVVHLGRMKGGARRVLRISELVGLSRHSRYVVRDLFGFEQSGIRNGHAIGEFRALGKVPRFLHRLHTAGIDLDPGMFSERIIARCDVPPSMNGYTSNH
jgi:pilus assembly protein CpaF